LDYGQIDDRHKGDHRTEALAEGHRNEARYFLTPYAPAVLTPER